LTAYLPNEKANFDKREKMFRDRLRQWDINNKNQRSAGRPRRRALQVADNGDKAYKSGPHNSKIGRNSLRSAMLDNGNIHNVLQTPKEMLVLQGTFKGLLNWQQHTKGSTVDPDQRWTFHDMLLDMRKCLFVSENNPSACEKMTPHLQRISAKLRTHMITCTPLAVLDAVGHLSYFANRRNSSPWYYETSRFLVNAAAEAFPESHPSLLLLHLILSTLTSSQLLLMYKLGSEVIEHFYGDATAFYFRVEMHRVASRSGLGATIRSYADALCAAEPDATHPQDLYDIATLYRSINQHKESADAVRRYLAQIEDEAEGDCSTPIHALQFLALVQGEQNDVVGEETTLQKLLKVTLARDRGNFYTSQLSIDVLGAVSMLEAFYVRHDLNEQRDALHLEYPSAFEL
jgi:hypothetical protein